MAFRNIFTKFSKDELENGIMRGELEVEYTGEVYYDVNFDVEDFSWPGGGIFEPPFGDVYYGCSCDFKEIKSFKKVEKE